MAVAYIEKYDGYIADTPNLDFERCDGTAFSYYEVNSSDFNDTLNFLTITGGQGTSPLAYVPTDRTTEFSFESSQFTIDMFAMSHAERIQDGDFGTRESARYEATKANNETNYKITLPFEVQAGSVRIRGLEEAVAAQGGTAAAASGKFLVTITAATPAVAAQAASGTQGEDDYVPAVEAADAVEGQTVIEIVPGDINTDDPTIRVSYVRRVVDGHQIVVTTASSTAKGELWAHYPVYSSGTDCTDASIKGWVHIHLPRVRVTQLPNFSTSYKSAATNGVTFSAIDAKLASKKYFDITYEPTDSEGEIVNTTENTEVTFR